ncbi:MAG: hypothetical protein ACYC9M_11155 [Desulfobulbaceae bacterium]
MSVELLLEALRQRSAERTAAIWRQAEDDAAALRAEQVRELAAARELLAGQRGEAERALAEPIIREAEIKALRIRDDACRALAGRLYGLAKEQLARVRQAEYPAIFAGLVAELPEDIWSEVRVNPQDLVLARLHFTGAEIKGDPSITGGFATVSDGGRHQVISTLERRLERAWPFAQPQLLREAEKEINAAPVD